MGSDAALGHLVHTLRSYLHLDPLLLGAEDGDVETLVAVRLRHAEPVAQTLGVGLVHVGDDGVHLPALHLLLLDGGVEDDADGEEVVDALEGALLLLHLLPDGVYGLRAALDVEVQSGSRQPFADGLDELLDVGVAALLRLAELLADHVVGFVLEVLQREVFEFGLQLVESQLVGQRGIEISGLAAHLHLVLRVCRVAYLPHEVHAVGNHDEDDAHILGKRQQEVAEVVALDDGVLIVELAYALQAAEDEGHGGAELLADGVGGDVAVLETGVQQRGQHGVAAQSYLVDDDECRLQSCQYGVQSEGVAPHLLQLDAVYDVRTDFLLVVGSQRPAQTLAKLGVKRQCFLFFGC